MKEMPTKDKVRFIMPEIIIVRGVLYSPKVELTHFGNQVILEPIISTDEEVNNDKTTND